MTVEEQDKAQSDKNAGPAEAPVEPGAGVAAPTPQQSARQAGAPAKSFRPSPQVLKDSPSVKASSEESRSFTPEGEGTAVRPPSAPAAPEATKSADGDKNRRPAGGRPAAPGARRDTRGPAGAGGGKGGERSGGRPGDKRNDKRGGRGAERQLSNSPIPQKPLVPIPIKPFFDEDIEEDMSGIEQDLLDEMSEFDEQIDQYLPEAIQEVATGDIVDAVIVGVKEKDVLLDVGDKAECSVPKEEFLEPDGSFPYKTGDTVKVYVKGRSDQGQFYVSFRRALRMMGVTKVQDAFKKHQILTGLITKEVKGGLIVDIDGVQAFLPASHVDMHRVDNLAEWANKEIKCYIIDFNRDRKRIIASRRAVLEEEQDLVRDAVIGKLEVGEVIGATVKSITDFGAFVDLGGGVDGLIPREEMSWERGGHPNQYVKVGDPVSVKVLSITKGSSKTKISLSRKQAKADPFEILPVKYPENSEVDGEIVGITHFGAFVRIEEGIQGMIHVSDLSWSGGNKRVKDFVKEGDKVRCQILEIDQERRRLSLGMKQLVNDPWELIEHRFPKGARLEGEVTSLVQYGAFVKVADDLEGLVHISDFSWDRKITKPSQMLKKGDRAQCVVLEVDRENRRLSLGMKQLEASPFEQFLATVRVGDKVKGKVTKIETFGAFVEVANGVEGLLHVSQISEDRVDDPRQIMNVGDEVDVKVTKVDRKNEKVSLSRREVIRDIERDEIQTYMQTTEAAQTGGGTLFGELLRQAQLTGSADSSPVGTSEASEPEGEKHDGDNQGA